MLKERRWPFWRRTCPAATLHCARLHRDGRSRHPDLEPCQSPSTSIAVQPTADTFHSSLWLFVCPDRGQPDCYRRAIAPLSRHSLPPLALSRHFLLPRYERRRHNSTTATNSSHSCTREQIDTEVGDHTRVFPLSSNQPANSCSTRPFLQTWHQNRDSPGSMPSQRPSRTPGYAQPRVVSSPSSPYLSSFTCRGANGVTIGGSSSTQSSL